MSSNPHFASHLLRTSFDNMYLIGPACAISVPCMLACNVLAFLLRILKLNKSSLLRSNLVRVPLGFDLSNTIFFLCFLCFLHFLV